MKKTTRQFRNFEVDLLERLADYGFAKIFLAVALEEFEKDGDAAAFLLALHDAAKAQGGILKLAQRTKLNRQNLHKALSAKSTSRLDTVGTILNGLGFRLSVEPLDIEKKARNLA